MRIVVLSRTPSWYPWRNDRCLQQLAGRGHDVLTVIVERSSTGAFLSELFGKFGPRVFVQKVVQKLARSLTRGGAPPSGAGPAPGTTVRPEIVRVDAHNSAACVEELKARRPDLIVLRGTGIIRRRVLAVPAVGTLNAHYGALPRWRGMDVTEWTVLYGGTPAVTIHFVDAGVDTGAVLASEELVLEPGDSLGSLADKSAETAARLLAAAATDLEAGVIEPSVQEKGAGRQFYAMHPRVRALAERALALRLDRLSRDVAQERVAS